MRKRKRDMGEAASSPAPVAGSESKPSLADDLRLLPKDGALRLEIQAKPRASKSAVRGVRDGALEVALAAPPVDGAANEELVRFLADRLGLAKRDVRLLRGEGARTKLVAIAGLEAGELLRRLETELEHAGRKNGT